MTGRTLIVDPNRVKNVGYRRLADVLDHEFQHTGEGTPCFASDSNFSVARCIRSSLSYGVKDVKESDTNRELMLKLSAHSIRAAVASKVIDKQDCDEKQLESCALNLSLKDAKKSKHNDKTELHNAVDNDSGISDAPRDDVASGQRIKFLLQDQKDLSAKDLEVEQRTQALLVSELTELTSMLKDSTLEINRAVNLQNIQLSAMAGFAADNRDELESQKQKMKENTTVMATSVWATVWLIVWVLLMFCGAYAVIRLFPAPRNYPTCPNQSYGHGEL